MTLSSSTVKLQYAGNGSQTSFPVTFIFWDPDDLLVTHRDSSGTETTWTRGTQYTVTGGLGGATGTIEVDTGPPDYTPASGETLTITSNLSDVQLTDLAVGGAFPSQSVEQQFDKTTRLVQQKEERLGRAMKFPISDPSSAIGDLPAVANRKGKGLGFNSSTGAPEAVDYADGSSTSVTATGSLTSRTEADRWAEVFNPLDHDCAFDGSTDDATAFQTMVAKAEAAAPSAIIMPVGTTNWGSTVTIDTSKVALIGQSPYQTIIRGTHDLGDILHIDGSAGALTNFYLANFKITSSVSKTSGAGLHLEKVDRSLLENIIIDGQDGTGNLYHGIWFDGVDFVTMRGFEARAQQDGIRVNGADGNPRADLGLWGGKVASCGIGLHIAGDFGGICTDYCDIINNTTNVVIDQDEVAAANREVFFSSSCLIDSATGVNVSINDPNLGFVFFDGTWIASAGTYGVQIVDGGTGHIQFTGGVVYNNGSDGLLIDDASCAVVIGGGVSFKDNGGYGINASVATTQARLLPNQIHFAGNTSGDVEWTNIRPQIGQTIQVSIADDGFYSLNPTNVSGLLFVSEAATSTIIGFGRYACAAGGGETADISSKATVAWTTGALTGTTGTDGNLTISAHSDGKLYIENRRGGTRQVVLTFVGGDASFMPLG